MEPVTMADHEQAVLAAAERLRDAQSAWNAAGADCVAEGIAYQTAHNWLVASVDAMRAARGEGGGQAPVQVFSPLVADVRMADGSTQRIEEYPNTTCAETYQAADSTERAHEFGYVVQYGHPKPARIQFEDMAQPEDYLDWRKERIRENDQLVESDIRKAETRKALRDMGRIHDHWTEPKT